MSEQLYSIKEQTLIDISDALRRKLGENMPGFVLCPAVITKTPNATGHDNIGMLEKELSWKCYPVQIEGAASIKLIISVKRPVRHYISFKAGYYTDHNDYSAGHNAVSVDKNILIRAEYLFTDTDCVTVAVNCYTGDEAGFYAEVIGYDENGVAISNENTVDVEVAAIVPRAYTSAEMAAAIDNIVIEPLEVTENGTYKVPEGIAGYGPVVVNVSTGGGDIEPIVLSGNCSYACAGPVAGTFIDKFGNMISTSDITNGEHMFDGIDKGHYSQIPFDIKFKKNTNVSFSYGFGFQTKLTQIGDIVGLKPSNLSNLFYYCNNLRQLPNFIDLDMSYLNTYKYGSMAYMFSHCFSLRSIPEDFLKQMYNMSDSAYSAFGYNSFYYCYTLDEIKGLMPGAPGVNYTSNLYSTSFSSCHRLKDIIFATQEDGTPLIRNMKSQIIDLSFRIGYTENSSSIPTNITGYNSGITEDKMVTDGNYELLKNDPDWWTKLVKYSRYNHDSAVNTINSLPDTSAYLATAGGTNTIKFKGEAGSATDGGAINTLTEEEIAVATAKGWTVTFG